jgi:hypothetical protein
VKRSAREMQALFYAMQSAPDEARKAIRAQIDRDITAMFTPGTFTTNDIGRTPRPGRFTVVDDILLGHRHPPFTRAETIDLEGDFLRRSTPKPRTPAKDALIDLNRGEGYFYK